METKIKDIGDKELADYKIYLMTSGFADRSIETYVHRIREFLRYITTEKSIEKLTEVTPEVVTQYHIYVANLKFNGKPLSMITQNQKIHTVMSFFRFLVREKHYLYDPTSHIKIKTPPPRRVRQVLSEKEMIKLLNAPNPERMLGLRNKALVELYYSCGIRNTESRMLTINDVDLENRTVRIRHPKGGGDHTVPIGKVAALYIGEYLKHSRPMLAKNELEQTLFLSRSGRPLTQMMPAYIVKRCAKLAGLKRKVDAHTLRHTCGTHLYNNGADIRCVQELLRHKNLDTTQIYIEVKETQLRKVLERTHPREKGMVYASPIE